MVSLHHFPNGAIMWRVPLIVLSGCRESGFFFFSMYLFIILSAVPASACGSFARANKEQRTSEVAGIRAASPSPTDQGTRTRTEPGADARPPKEKRAKRERDDDDDEEEELEDGELTDSSGGEGEEPEEGAGHPSPADNADDVKEEPEDSCC